LAKVRRTKYLFVYPEDRRWLDVAAMLRGEAQVAPLRQVFAISILAAEEYPLSRLELEALLEVPSDRWVDAATVPADSACVAGLVRRGLLLSDEADDVLAEFRRREERLSSDRWHLYAALFHFLTRWRDIDLGVEAGEAAGDERTLTETWIHEFGNPPPHFHTLAAPARVEELPLVRREGGLYEALARRRTVRSFDVERPMTAEELGVVLFYAFGCHRYLPVTDDVVALGKTSPSGGGLHPTEIYPLLLRVEGLEPGVYHYEVGRHALALIEPLSLTEATLVAEKFTCNQGFAQHAHALFVLSARFYRSYWKYRRHKRAYGVLLLDAGHLSQTFYLVCADLGLGAFVTAAVNGIDIEERLGLDGFGEGVLAVCGCGIPSALPSPEEPRFIEYVPRETVVSGPGSPRE
jgi:putative peptide maturation dehydrogenase